VSGNAYFRQNRIKTFNGDNSNYADCNDGSGKLCDENGVVVVDIDKKPIDFTSAVDGATTTPAKPICAAVVALCRRRSPRLVQA